MTEKKRRTGAGRGDHTAALLARIAELEERVVRLEAARDAAVSNLVSAAAPAAVTSTPHAPRAVTAEPATEAREEIAEDTLVVIAAAVAAFLGEGAHIRQVRLVASEAWAQQGRVSVMASHRWAASRKP